MSLLQAAAPCEMVAPYVSGVAVFLPRSASRAGRETRSAVQRDQKCSKHLLGKVVKAYKDRVLRALSRQGFTTTTSAKFSTCGIS